MENTLEILSCDKFGDYAIAARDFEEGEVIFEEDPIMTAPEVDDKGEEARISCIGCFKFLDQEYIQCGACGWPACSQECVKKGSVHRQLECGLFIEKCVAPLSELFVCVRFVRIALMKAVSPKEYRKFLSLSGDFKNQSEAFKDEKTDIALQLWKVLTSNCRFKITLEEVRKIRSVIKINSFQLSWRDALHLDMTHRGMALFPLASKLAHSCFHNVEWIYVKGVEDGNTTWKIVMTSRTKIKKGDPLTIAYTDKGLNYGTGYRREFLENELIFSCLCDRCLDATEVKTFMSSPKCSKCIKGNLLPDEPLNSLSCRWSCSRPKCKFTQDGNEIHRMIEKLLQEARSLMADKTYASVDRLDSFIDQHSGKTLHENHFVLHLSTMHWLQVCRYSKLKQATVESAEYYVKLLRRLSRCNRLSRRVLPTKDFVNLELSVAHIVASYGFKVPNAFVIPSKIMDVPSHHRLSKRILHHISEACKWINIQPTYLQGRKEGLENLKSKWEEHSDLVSLKLSMEDDELEGLALLNIN